MKRFCIVLLPLLLVLGCTEPIPTAVTLEETVVAGKKGQNKVDVCHVTGNGSSILITIAEAALPAHLNHGDGQPGDPVPGMEGFVFDESCDPVIAVPTDGLVAYYPFNGNTNDESSNGNHGTVFGASLTNDRFGNSNSAYSLDGVDDYLVAPHQPWLNLPGDFTLSAWVLSDVTQGANNFVIAKGAGVFPLPHEYALYFANGDNKPRFSVNNASFNNSHLHPPVIAPTDEWIHILAVAESGVLRLYVDAVELASGSYTYSSTTTDLFFGLLSPQYYRGSLDDIRIYNRALTDAEIQVLFNE